MKKVAWGLFFHSEEGILFQEVKALKILLIHKVQLSNYQIYPDTLPQRDFRCLPICFIAICKI